MPASSLLKRTLTALVLLPLVFGWLLFSGSFFPVIMLFLCGLAAWEWALLAGWEQIYRPFYAAAACLTLALALWLDQGMLKYLGLLGWVLAPLLILSYPATSWLWQGRLRISLMGLLILSTTGAALLELHRQSPLQLFPVFVFLVAGVDTASYLVGRHLGKHRLLPKVSPAKTWEGLLAGVAGAVPLALLGFWLFKLDISPAVAVIFALALALASVTGDLMISMLKRNQKLKSTGDLLLGHGGILDRIDSSLAAAPVYALGISFLVV